ncbi:MAG: aspartate/glutamate racemase family protein [Pseudomonadota bacterium]
MSVLPYDLDPSRPVQLGLIVLQEDETIERDFRQLLPDQVSCLVSRVPSGRDVTPDSLAAMADHITASAALMPRGAQIAAMGYACTSGAAQIGAHQIADLIARGGQAGPVTDPVSAVLAACRALGLRRLALVSPYVSTVSARLRDVLGSHGLDTPAFGSFGVSEEAQVSRISHTALVEGARQVARDEEVDGVFLSCTNLRSLPAIAQLEADLDLPVLSSNQVLAWHLLRLARVDTSNGVGRLFRTSLQSADK